MQTDLPNKSIAASSEYETLCEDVRRLRAELTVLLLQKDDLQLVQSKRIEAAYLRRFGALELKLYEIYCGCLRAKRKASMIRTKLNRREAVDLAAVEESLDEAFSQYREELSTRMDLLYKVLEPREAAGLTTAGRKELKTLYRQAVKALHPDLHTEAGEQETQLLQRAIEAYRRSDLDGLREVCDAIGSDPAEPVPENSLEALREEKKRLQRTVRRSARELESCKAAYPISMRVYLEDAEQGAAHQQELEEKIRTLQERRDRYEAGILQMLKDDEEEDE